MDVKDKGTANYLKPKFMNITFYKFGSKFPLFSNKQNELIYILQINIINCKTLLTNVLFITASFALCY